MARYFRRGMYQLSTDCCENFCEPRKILTKKMKTAKQLYQLDKVMSESRAVGLQHVPTGASPLLVFLDQPDIKLTSSKYTIL